MTHETQVKGKLMSELHSHSHLKGQDINRKYIRRKDNLESWLITLHSTTSILENTDHIPTLTPIEAVVSPLAGVQRSEPGSNFRLEVWQNWGNGSTWIMSDGKHCKNQWKYGRPGRGYKRSVEVVNWEMTKYSWLWNLNSKCICKNGIVTKRKHDEQQWRR